MTQTAPEAAAQAASNGKAAPAAAGGEAPCEDCATPASERIMGVLGLLFAAALAAIALDLLTGGALSRAAGLGAVEGDQGGQPGAQ